MHFRFVNRVIKIKKHRLMILHTYFFRMDVNLSKIAFRLQDN